MMVIAFIMIAPAGTRVEGEKRKTEGADETRSGFLCSTDLSCRSVGISKLAPNSVDDSHT